MQTGKTAKVDVLILLQHKSEAIYILSLFAILFVTDAWRYFLNIFNTIYIKPLDFNPMHKKTLTNDNDFLFSSFFFHCLVIFLAAWFV